VFLLLLLLHRLKLFIFPPKKGKIAVFSHQCSSNQCKTDRFPAKFSQKTPTKLTIFTNCFSAKFTLKIPVNFPWNLPFFPQICLWKSRKICLFFLQPIGYPVYPEVKCTDHETTRPSNRRTEDKRVYVGLISKVIPFELFSDMTSASFVDGWMFHRGWNCM